MKEVVSTEIETFRTLLDLSELSYLREYQLYGCPLFPFAAALELALAAACSGEETNRNSLHQVVYHEALLFSRPGTLAIETTLRQSGSDGATFTISHADAPPRIDSRSGPQIEGRASYALLHALPPLDLRQLRARFPTPLSSAQCYQRFQTRGLAYGQCFQGIRQLWRGSDEALGQILCPSSLLPELSFYQVHPALLDACLQVAQFALLSDTDQACYVPVGLDQLAIYQRPAEEVWSHVRFTESAHPDRPEIRGDITLMDRQGQIQVQIRGLRLRRVTRLAQLVPLSLLQHYGYISHDVLVTSDVRERLELLENYLSQRIAQATGLPLSRLAGVQQFADLALDSIIAMELKQQIDEDLHIDLPVKSFAQAISIRQMAEELSEQLSGPAISRRQRFASFPQERYQPFPLNDIQQAYWVGRDQAFELGNVASHIYAEYDWPEVDVDRLNRCWQQLIQRHDMLRAVILPTGYQHILEEVPQYTIEVVDIREMEHSAALEILEAGRQEMTEQLRAGDQWPLFQLRLYLLGQGRTRLYIWLDLLIADAMSFRTMMQEWLELYQKPDAVLPPLTLTFRDYLLNERAVREAEPEAYTRAREYWLRRLPTLPPAPELPGVQQTGGIKKPSFLHQVAELDRQTWSRIKARAAQAGITPAMVLCSAFTEILTTWSARPDFTLVLTRFNRLPLHQQVKEIVGDFTSTTLLSVEYEEGPFEKRAQRLQQQLWENLEYHQMSGVQVLREMARRQGDAAKARVPVVFTCILEGASASAIGNEPDIAEFSRVNYLHSRASQIWLDNQLYERDGTLIITWEALQDAFPSGLPRDMFQAYVRLLYTLAENEQRWLENLTNLLPPDQLHQRLEVNATQAPVPTGLLHTGFLQQVLQRPEHCAVSAPGRTLTYRDLDVLSRHTGWLLYQMGARPDTLVGVVMEKGWEQVVAVLSVLRSGAAYLPIDPHLPRERLWYLLERGEVQLVLTQPWIEKEVIWPDGIQRLCITGERPDPSAGAALLDLEPLQQPDNLAYVIFTSGSTGLPKGVAIDHHGALNTVVDVNRRFQVGPEDRVLALSALNFDLSVYDIFGLLATGGTIVLPASDKANDPAHWAELVVRERVTIWNTVPALMEMFVTYVAGLPEMHPSSLRLVLMSGDWIPVSLPNRIKALVPGCELISMGGATEASIWSILYPITAVDPQWKSIPYGRPMVNQRFYVLNKALEPCPTWVPGDLYIGGIGLAKEYWRDAEKTAASFLRHPRTGERIYRTGDLGRYLPDGTIEFLGRSDFQVKIHGYRIELGEIEAALRQHPAVQECIVLAREDEQQDKRLVAYVIQQPLSSSDQAHNEDAGLGDMQIDQWRLVYDEMYGRTLGQATLESAFLFTGWNSAYTNEPFSREEMSEWVDTTVARIKDLQPERVLEIGCGTGLLLLRLAPLCKHYRATDFSAMALRIVERQMQEAQEEFPDVTLLERQADDFTGLEEGTFDTVIINSVVQYFPGIEYLLTVLEKALKMVKPGGALFLGDLRNFALQELYWLAVALHLAPDELSCSQLSQQFQKRAQQDEELAVDPALFVALQQRFPAIARVEILHKRGRYHNELTQFRYDVVLHVGETVPVSEPEWLDWQEAALSLAKVKQMLEEPKLTELCLSRVPNARLTRFAQAHELLQQGTAPATAGELRGQLSEGGVDPEEFVLLTENTPYIARITWAGTGNETCYNVIIQHRQAQRALAHPSGLEPSARPWKAYGNDPLRNVAARHAAAHLRRFLEQKLPDYMIPSAFVFLDTLPLTSNGKIDRRALPAPEQAAQTAGKDRTVPRTDVEVILADIWKEVLSVEVVGIYDDFFDLGGHSLLATQIVTRLRETFEIDLPLAALFRGSTIAELAVVIEELLLDEIEQLSDEEVERQSTIL